MKASSRVRRLQHFLSGSEHESPPVPGMAFELLSWEGYQKQDEVRNPTWGESLSSSIFWKVWTRTCENHSDLRTSLAREMCSWKRGLGEPIHLLGLLCFAASTAGHDHGTTGCEERLGASQADAAGTAGHQVDLPTPRARCRGKGITRFFH